MNHAIIDDPRHVWPLISRAARSAAYDNTNAVAGSAMLNQARVDASAAYRVRHHAALDLPYRPGERTQWDLYPAPDPLAPCLVFIHGGYWWKNRRQDFACLAEGVARHGWSVGIPGYNLAPDIGISDIITEINSALDWLQANGAAHGVAGPVVLSGWSAGGHLAAMALDHPVVAAGFSISGIFELGPLRDTDINDKLRLTDAEIETGSPLRLPVVRKPFTIAYGSAELPALIHDSRNFHAYRAASHAPGLLVPVAGADHFTIVEQLRASDSLLTGQIITLAAPWA